MNNINDFVSSYKLINSFVPFQDPDTNEEDDGKNEEEDAPISFPKNNACKAIWFIITIPTLIPFYLTLPDVKNNSFTILPSFKVPGK